MTLTLMKNRGIRWAEYQDIYARALRALEPPVDDFLGTLVFGEDNFLSITDVVEGNSLSITGFGEAGFLETFSFCGKDPGAGFF